MICDNGCLSCGSFSKSVFSSIERNIVSQKAFSNVVEINFKKGQDVFNEGSAVKGVFCIRNGKVKVFRNCEAKNITLSLAGNSDLIGFTGLLNGATYINSAKCLEDSEICFFPKSIFLDILLSSNELQLTLLKRSSYENYCISNFIKVLKCKNMRSRVANALFEVNKKFGLDENNCLNICLTRKEIAELSGTTTESVIRILNDLKKEKIVDFVNNRIKLLDINKLQFYL